jgi:nicotinamide riboside kinase
LARHFGTIFVPEYARKYVAGLNRPYTYEDVEHIANTQVRQLQEYSVHATGLIFLDTHLIITKVWFDEVFHRRPEWISKVIAAQEIDLYLLCHTDIPWVPDPVRENGGERREALYRIYRKELEHAGCPYAVVTGMGEDRLRNAIELVDYFIKQHGYGGAKI